MKKFTKKEDNFLRKHFMDIPAKRMSSILGRSENAARQRMKILGIVVPADIIEKFKQLGRFKKGNLSFNKGKKAADYMTKKGLINSKKTRFKKGDLPKNTKSDGEISIRTDNRGVKYQWIRISLSKWIPLHRYIWQNSNGKIPNGFKLVFRDNNTMNCTLDNLELVTHAELMKRNSYHTLYPLEIRQVIQLGGALTRKLNSKSKLLKNEK